MLSVELVPSTSQGHNVRSAVSTAVWDVIRRSVYRKAGYVCQICGGRGPKHPVECHEVFSYNERTHIQTLTGFLALCPACHAAKHIGQIHAAGDLRKTKKHLMRVNGWTLKATDQYLDKVFKTWVKRSLHPWTVDLSLLKEYGIDEDIG